MDETVDHLFVCCERIRGLLGCLREWCGRLGEVFSHGPRYKGQGKREVCLLNFFLGSAKRAIWKTQRNKILGGRPY